MSNLFFDKKGYIKACINGRNGFTIKNSILELIQNSIDAGSTKIYINHNKNEDKLFIIDNGNGMTYDEIKDMSKLYKHNETSKDFKHGKFGIGAKQGWFQIGGNLVIFSKKKIMKILFR